MEGYSTGYESPPRLKKRARRAPLSNADLALLHGLQPVPTASKRRTGGTEQYLDASTTAAEANVEAGGGLMEASRADALEESVAKDHKSRNTAHRILPWELDPARRAPTSPPLPTLTASAELPPTDPPSVVPTSNENASEKEVEGCSAKENAPPAAHPAPRRGVSSEWAARVLSPIVKEESRRLRQARKTRSSKKTSSNSSDTSDEDEDDDSNPSNLAPITVEDFLIPNPGGSISRKKLKKQYGTSPKNCSRASRIILSSTDTEDQPSPKRLRRSPNPLRVAAKPRPYGSLQASSSSSDSEQEDIPSLPKLPSRKRKLQKVSELGKVQFDEKFGEGGQVLNNRAPYEVRVKKWPQLSFERDSQLDEDSRGFYEGKKRKHPFERDRTKLSARYCTTKWLGGIGDTAFAKRKSLNSEEVVEDKEMRRRKRRRRFGGDERGILSRKLEDAQVAKLLDVESRGEKVITGDWRKRARVVPLEMISIEEVDEEIAFPIITPPLFKTVVPSPVVFTRPNHSPENLNELPVLYPATQKDPPISKNVIVLAPATPPPSKPPRKVVILAPATSSPLPLPSTTSPSTIRKRPREPSWGPTTVNQLSHSFRRVPLPAPIRSTVSKPAPVNLIMTEPNSLNTGQQSSAVEVDSLFLPPPPRQLHTSDIARLPTPKPPRFRFVTGPKAKRRPTVKIDPRKPRLEFGNLFGDDGEESQLSTLSSLWVEKTGKKQLEFIEEETFDQEMMEERECETREIDEEGTPQVDEAEAKEIDSSAEYGEVEISSSQMAVLVPSPSPSFHLPSASPSPTLSPLPPTPLIIGPPTGVRVRPLQRRVTFSSPVIAPSRRLPNPSRSEIKSTRSKSLINVAPENLVTNRRTSTTNGPPKKLLRRLSLQPNFKLPSSPLPPSSPQLSKQFIIDEYSPRATHQSSHSYTSDPQLSFSPLIPGQQFPELSESLRFEKELKEEVDEYHEKCKRRLEGGDETQSLRREDSVEWEIRRAEEDGDEEFWLGSYYGDDEFEEYEEYFDELDEIQSDAESEGEDGGMGELRRTLLGEDDVMELESQPAPMMVW